MCVCIFSSHVIQAIIKQVPTWKRQNKGQNSIQEGSFAVRDVSIRMKSSVESKLSQVHDGWNAVCRSALQTKSPRPPDDPRRPPFYPRGEKRGLCVRRNRVK